MLQQCIVQVYVVMKTASYLVNHAISNQATIYGVLIAFFKVVLYRQLIDDLHVHTGIT